jgi:hypothetical protein
MFKGRVGRDAAPSASVLRKAAGGVARAGASSPRRGGMRDFARLILFRGGAMG